jgi:excisionase family DNA binding protein
MHLVTPTEAARRLGVAQSTIRRWIDGNLIQAFRTVGGHRRVDLETLRLFAVKRGLPFLDPETEEMDETRGGLLVVDDDQALLDLLVGELERALPNLEIHATTSSFEAGALAASVVPDVIFLDLRMPGMDGIEVCRIIRGRPELRETRIAAITAFHRDPRMVEAFLAAGGDRVFAKPADIDEITAFIMNSETRVTSGMSVQERAAVSA